MSDQADSPATSRRDFVSSLAVSGLAAVTACAGSKPSSAPAPSGGTAPAPAASAAVTTTPPAQAPVQLPPTRDDGPWDMSWLERVDRAKHRLVFDIGAYQNGGGLYYARNYINGMRDGWGAAAPDVLPILGISGNAYPIVFGDATWEKYAYGVSSKTTDPRTGQPAIRNVFWHPRQGESMAPWGVDVLQGMGCQFLFCNNVFRGVIRGAMQKTGRPYAEVRAELVAGMLPGVIVVPAMVAAMAMAQSRGAGYVFAGG